MLRRLLPVAVLLCCSGILGTGTASATALPIQDCTTTSGVIVAVDFSHWGGPVVRGCGSTPTTGYQLVNQGGFATTGTAHDGPGFICRISYRGFNGGTGEPADQKCLTTPPASASWSYWNANPGQSSWTLSPTGAANTDPPGGAVQAWTFGGSPNFSPAAVRAQNSSPASGARSSSAKSSSAKSTSASRGGTSAPVSQPTAPGSSTKGAAGNSPVAGRTSQSAGTGRAGSPASAPATSATGTLGILTLGSASPTASQRIVDAEPDPAPHPSGSGSYIPELAGGAIVLGLAGLAGFTMWQRKRAG
jgi:hypothetical protein